MAYCRRHKAALLLQYVCALCLWLCVLGAALFALPATVRHVALFAIGIDAYATVARCTATGGCGTVPVPPYTMLWLLTAAVLGPLDVFVFGYGDWADEALYWAAKLHVLLVLRAVMSREHHRELNRAVAESQLPNALYHVRGDNTEWWSVQRLWRPGLLASFHKQSVQPIQQFFADNAQVMDEVMKTMRLYVYTETLPATLFQCQWSSLRSLQFAAVSFTLHASTMDALIRATPNICQLSMSGYTADPQFAADWALADGWSELRKVTMASCDYVLWHCVILQTMQLTHATFNNIWPHIDANPPLLRECVRRNGGTLTHFSTNSFGMDELEELAQCRRLHYIYANCRGEHWAAFTWSRFAALIQSIVSLRVVLVADPAAPSDIALAPGSLSHLMAFMLYSTHIPKQAVHSILQAAPNVHSLQLSTEQGGIDIGTLRSIVTSLPQLRKLMLWSIETINDGVFHTIATALPQLTHLYLQYNSIMDVDSGDAGRWATVHSVPQRMLTHIRLILLFYTTAHKEAELESVERLRTALRALARRSHSVLGTALVMFDYNYMQMDTDDVCDYEWPPPAWMHNMLPDEWPDIRDLLW